MNQSHRYVPSHEKWIKHYDRIGTSEHPHYFNFKNPVDRNIGIRDKHVEIKTHSSDTKVNKPTSNELKVEFVSPAQQIVEQAASEIKRERGIKRKLHVSTPKAQSSKQKARKRFKLNDDGNKF